jgi:hypothetical protein
MEPLDSRLRGNDEQVDPVFAGMTGCWVPAFAGVTGNRATGYPSVRGIRRYFSMGGPMGSLRSVMTGQLGAISAFKAV